MKKSIAPLLFGLIFILGGLGYLGAMLFNWSFDIFFDGWWTLFILVPTFVSILSNGPKVFNCTAFLLGGILLLQEQNFIDERNTGTAIVATIIIAIGISMIARYFFPSYYKSNNQSGTYTFNTTTQTGTDGQPVNQTININSDPNYNSNYSDNNAKNNHKTYSDNTSKPNYTAILSGVESRNCSQNLEGGSISAILGGAEIDLRETVINQDIVIYATAIMGGIEILAPRNVRINLKKTDIMGGTTCKAYSLPFDANAPIVNFDCTTVMGGIEIK